MFWVSNPKTSNSKGQKSRNDLLVKMDSLQFLDWTIGSFAALWSGGVASCALTVPDEREIYPPTISIAQLWKSVWR